MAASAARCEAVLFSTRCPAPQAGLARRPLFPHGSLAKALQPAATLLTEGTATPLETARLAVTGLLISCSESGPGGGRAPAPARCAPGGCAGLAPGLRAWRRWRGGGSGHPFTRSPLHHRGFAHPRRGNEQFSVERSSD